MKYIIILFTVCFILSGCNVSDTEAIDTIKSCYLVGSAGETPIDDFLNFMIQEYEKEVNKEIESQGWYSESLTRNRFKVIFIGAPSKEKIELGKFAYEFELDFNQDTIKGLNPDSVLMLKLMQCPDLEII